MQTLARLAGGIIIATPFRVIDVTSTESEAEGIHWWDGVLRGVEILSLVWVSFPLT